MKNEITRLKKEKEKYTNIKAPELEKDTHFGVTETLEIGTEEEKQETGFSLLSMFGREIETEEVDEEEEKEEEMESEIETVVASKPVPVKKGSRFIYYLILQFF